MNRSFRWGCWRNWAHKSGAAPCVLMADQMLQRVVSPAATETHAVEVVAQSGGTVPGGSGEGGGGGAQLGAYLRGAPGHQWHGLK